MKYLIWEVEELLEVATEGELLQLDTIVDRMIHRRERLGLPVVKDYIVVDTDKAYSKAISDMVKQYEEMDT